ncbi:MAG TPA: glycosyltransferase [Ktedonobacterales bacterium]|jgi:glycosyltransferase involved in cell wall biosynthesis
MRIVIVSKTFVAETAQRQLEWIARQPDIELTLVTPSVWRSDDGRRLPFVPHFVEGYEVRKVPVVFNGQYHLYFYPGLGAVVRQQRPDLVHIDEEPYNPAGAQAQWLADALGARTVFVSWQNLYRTYPAPYAWIERYNYRRAAAIIAGNTDAANVLRRKGYTGPTAIFSVHGIDTDIYRPLPHTTPPGAFVIGYLGRLVLYKGVGLLIEALQGMPEHCRLRLVGSGPDERALRRIASELGVAARIDFAPAIAAADVPHALAEMDVLAAPSLTQPNWKEQFGRVLIEAMACGVPVIGSDSGEIPHVIGAAGMIVPEGDVEALRVGLLRLAHDAAMRERFSLAGRARVLDQFTQERVAQRTVAVYHEALGLREARG